MYAKLFTSIYQGTLRGNSNGILVFTNMLAHCDKHGICDIHPRAIAEEVGLSIEAVRSAILELEAPDEESRSPEEEGRRIVRVDEHRAWGWRVVNYLKYRAIRDEDTRREQNRAAQEAWRLRKQGKPASAKASPDQPIQRQKQKQEAEGEEERKSASLAGASAPPLKPASGVKGASGAKKASPPAKPDDVEQQVWDDWLALRKAKNAPVTETVLKRAKDEAAKAGLSLDGFLIVWCARGSQGLEASWLKPGEGKRAADVEPAWRRQERERYEQFTGKKPAESKVINMGEVFDVTAVKLG